MYMKPYRIVIWLLATAVVMQSILNLYKVYNSTCNVYVMKDYIQIVGDNCNHEFKLK